jgi:hypothetical protein
VAAHRVGDAQKLDGIEGATFHRLRNALTQEVVGKEISPDGGWIGRVHPGRVADIKYMCQARWFATVMLAMAACAKADQGRVAWGAETGVACVDTAVA